MSATPDPAHVLAAGRYVIEAVAQTPRHADLRAWDTHQQRQVALRRHRLPADADQSVRELLLQKIRERTDRAARDGAALVAPLLDVFVEDDRLWTVTPCERVLTLGARLSGTPHVCGMNAAQLAKTIAAHLEALHSAGLSHGGLDQWCVLVDDQDNVKFAEYGVSTSLQSLGDKAANETTSPPTSFAHMQAVDAYSLGAIFLVLQKAAQRPHPGAAAERCSPADLRALRTLQLSVTGLTRISLMERLPASVARRALERVIAESRFMARQGDRGDSYAEH